MASGRNLHTAARLLKDLIEHYEDVEAKVRQIQDLEHAGDEITHTIVNRLNTSLITPMDREDIYALTSALDDVVDAIEASADLFLLQRIAIPLPEMATQARVLVAAAELTERSLGALPSMDRSLLEPHWAEIERLESEGDEVYRWALTNVFAAGHPEMDVLRWLEVIETLEGSINGLERVADVLETIVLKHA